MVSLDIHIMGYSLMSSLPVSQVFIENIYYVGREMPFAWNTSVANKFSSFMLGLKL